MKKTTSIKVKENKMKNRNSSAKQIKNNRLAERKNYRNHLFEAINNLETNLLDEKTVVLKRLVA